MSVRQPPSPKLILFDCDGTLVDSAAMISATMETAFRETGLTPPDPSETRAVVGLSLAQAMARLAQDQAEETQRRLVDAYREAFVIKRQDDTLLEPLYEGITDLLADFAARGLLMGVATGKSRAGLDAVLARHGIAERFITLQTADNHPSKPHPAMVERAMAEAGCGPGETAVVGDTSFDMEMARAAGAYALGVSWGYHPAHQLKSAGADRVVDRPAELEAALFGP
ncbi:MAG: HAD-IA family hydrolase [Geminicoccaceae bacterium]